MKKIEKPWGYELIYAQSDKYIGRILHIEKGEQLSPQYRSIKDKSIYLPAGVMNLTIEDDGQLKQKRVTPGGCYRIPPKIRHRFAALEQCDVLEVSTPELHDVVRRKDFYPSLCESFSLPNLEAMAGGKPVVSTELGAATGIVDRHGTTGFVESPNDAVTLADTLNKILNNRVLREQFGKNARERVTTDFDYRSTTGKYHELYQSCL
jgi:mannose-6-phosphate isomerase-like protein (cupin superfamily)